MHPRPDHSPRIGIRLERTSREPSNIPRNSCRFLFEIRGGDGGRGQFGLDEIPKDGPQAFVDFGCVNTRINYELFDDDSDNDNDDDDAIHNKVYHTLPAMEND
mmetsp:Transcript_1610/g.3367  ORF Transcript_1610/g.3367 Transcript_1610/m.3367 type:complete len:103 (-) Transcript_1610:6-314(-)